jgi:hypothetical protein
MRKWLIGVLLFIVATISLAYYFIPREISIAETVNVKVNQHPGYRAVIDNSKWQQWWPGKTVTQQPKQAGAAYSLNGVSYQPAQPFFEGMEVIINIADTALSSLLVIEPLKTDQSRLRWQTVFPAGGNPFSRLQNYWRAKTLKRDMAGVLFQLKVFLEKQENVYGIRIHNEMVKDTFLVTLKSTYNRYPEMSTVYSMIDTLRAYVRAHEATATNVPMLHVQPLEENKFEVMVALPVDRKLEDQPPIYFKRMVSGHILVTEVKGGRYSIDAALNQLENYLDDYKKVSPALPFQSLITNRLKESDTSRWVTRLYYPVL